LIGTFLLFFSKCCIPCVELLLGRHSDSIPVAYLPGFL